ncbi:putative Transmembrane protein [Quillaja saponaria]|uniref:Transmembrane protein n=1 Tax=Quillaja saponaria TaxID=32244 RepID=A0AAD7VHJ9_QUISA|nr:putative Transmembrane protein [Quillaja saponaria]
MENSMGAGFMAVLAVSGSMVLLVHQVHKRLLSDFIKKFEFELGDDHEKHQTKKKVRFAEQLLEPSSDNKEYRKRCMAMAMAMAKAKGQGQAKAGEKLVKEDASQGQRYGEKFEVVMPLNRLALYKGIIDYKTLKGHLHV